MGNGAAFRSGSGGSSLALQGPIAAGHGAPGRRPPGCPGWRACLTRSVVLTIGAHAAPICVSPRLLRRIHASVASPVGRHGAGVAGVPGDRGGGGRRPRPPSRRTEEPAMAAGAFVDSVGVNAAPGGRRRRLGAGRSGSRRPASATSGARRPPPPTTPPWTGCGPWPAPSSSSTWSWRDDADPEATVEAAASLGRGRGRARGPAPASGRRRCAGPSTGHPRLPAVAVLGSGPGVDYQAVRLDLDGRCPGCAADELGSGDAAVQVTEVDLGAGVPGAVAARYLPAAAAGQRRAGRPHLRGGRRRRRRARPARPGRRPHPGLPCRGQPARPARRRRQAARAGPPALPR